jgi:hypothetical protein
VVVAILSAIALSASNGIISLAGGQPRFLVDPEVSVALSATVTTGAVFVATVLEMGIDLEGKIATFGLNEGDSNPFELVVLNFETGCRFSRGANDAGTMFFLGGKLKSDSSLSAICK